jgi:hypothetical protein
MMYYRRAFLGSVHLVLLAGCATEQTISYRQDVYPILATNCLECHRPPAGTGYVQTRLNLETYQSLMKGTVYGPVIVPGNSRQSILNRLVEGRAGASLRMPHQRDQPLTAHEIEILRRWIDQGAPDN